MCTTLKEITREKGVTVDEWMAGVEMVRFWISFCCSPTDAAPFRFQINGANRMSDGKRNECQLLWMSLE